MSLLEGGTPLPTQYEDASVLDILNLSGWQVLTVHEDEHLYLFTAEVATRAASCPLCETRVIPYRFGLREHVFADLPMHGKYVRILAKRRRYRCKACRINRTGAHAGFYKAAPMQYNVSLELGQQSSLEFGTISKPLSAGNKRQGSGEFGTAIT